MSGGPRSARDTDNPVSRGPRRPVDLQLRGALPAARPRARLVAQALRPLGRRRPDLRPSRL